MKGRTSATQIPLSLGAPDAADLFAEQARREELEAIRAAQAADTESPFGPDDYEAMAPPKGQGFGEFGHRERGAKSTVDDAARVKGAIERLRLRRVPTAILPYAGECYHVVHRREITYVGTQVKVDWLGFADVAGVAKGRFVALQVTSKEGMNRHISQYVGDKTYGASRQRVEDLLRSFLANGGVFLVAGYFRADVGKSVRWDYDWWVVDEAMLDKFKARKRK